jgi:hypothetical protein
MEFGHSNRTIFHSHPRNAFQLSPIMPTMQRAQKFRNAYGASGRDSLDIDDFTDDFET